MVSQFNPITVNRNIFVLNVSEKCCIEGPSKPFNEQSPEMVRHSLKTLQCLLQNFWSMSILKHHALKV